MTSVYTLTRCTVADGPALAANNIPAFWADPHWVLSWRHRTLPYHVSQVAKRYPRSLLRDRDTTRHQKAGDPDTGALVGYARWYIPPSHAVAEGGKAVWEEAIVSGVGEEVEKEYIRVAAEEIWDNVDTDSHLEVVKPFEKEILDKQPFMRLEYLAVHPENQGKGIATALVQSGMKQAEALGLDIFVNASSKPGMLLYKKLGFEIKKDFCFDDSEFGGPGEHWVYLMTYKQQPKIDDD